MSSSVVWQCVVWVWGQRGGPATRPEAIPRGGNIGAPPAHKGGEEEEEEEEEGEGGDCKDFGKCQHSRKSYKIVLPQWNGVLVETQQNRGHCGG